MHHRLRLLAATIAAALLLAVAVGDAAANRLSISNQNVRATWSELEFSNAITTEVVRCPVTLEGSFHYRTIVKTQHALVGHITRGEVGTCTGGRATIHNESLPWHLTYESFAGTLPRITRVTLLLLGAEFEIEMAGNICSARTEAGHPAAGIAELDARGVVTGLRADESRRIPLVNGRGGLFCRLANGIFRGIAAVTLLGTTQQITLTLI